MNILNPQLLSLPRETIRTSDKSRPLKIPRHQGNEKFLKGPVPLNWISRATQLSGSAWHVGTAIWYLVGLTNSPTVKLTQATLDLLGISRYAKYRALAELKTAGLISFDAIAGKNPKITVIGHVSTTI